MTAMRPDSRRRALLFVMAAAVLLAACSQQQLYATGQAWHRSLCADYAGEARSRCEIEANKSYDAYRRAAVSHRER